MTIRQLLLIALFAIASVVTNPVLAAEAAEHADEEKHAEEEAGLTLDAAAREQAGIATAQVETRPLREIIQVPGEVTMNAYRSTKITPRISAQIIARHATLGDVVEKGAPLVTLSSVEMAEAQGALFLAQQEWQRVQSLGRDVVSESRYIEAQVAYQQAYARLL
ncbi:MAG TPA: efflux RND transporter periplasmic adaptor subunit, partial [Gammaproteobacteria bacterium]|nr:efflux RND transporter periplasmic adaptor subunit [Gammaproteobacteria bacterium]